MTTTKAPPRVTIVMTARERHGFTERAIDSIIRNTGVPYRLIYADSQAPEWLEKSLSRLAGEGRLEVMKFDAGLWPNQIRNRIAPAIATDYVVFLDNDISVGPDWLDHLVRCADETGAGIVCPLYLIGDSDAAAQIHMAGGYLNEIAGENGVALHEVHRLGNKYLADVAAELRRQECDFAEYHCMLIRTILAKEAAIFDDRIVCVHEHIDTALSVKKAGYKVYFEPEAQVTYFGLAPYALSDLEFFRARWAPEDAESSIQNFSSKWAVPDDERSFGGVRLFLHAHRIQTDPLRPISIRGDGPRGVMEPQDLQQTLAGLFDLAGLRSYRQEEWIAIEKAYRDAMILMNGVYRPCGRPFINHLAGTASVLLFYDFDVSLVVAALLHAAYTHGMTAAADPQANLDEVRRLLGGGDSQLERRVCAFTFRQDNWKSLLASPDWPSTVSIQDAEILAIAAANEVDMCLSGEYKFSGRPDRLAPDILGLITHACNGFGVPGLTQTLLAETRRLSLLPAQAKPGTRPSIRIVGAALVPAVNKAAYSMLTRPSR